MSYNQLINTVLDLALERYGMGEQAFGLSADRPVDAAFGTTAQ
jgi:hypothetical protein